jgi:hypothetical protein
VGETSLFRAVRYDEEESVQALHKIHEGFAARDDYIIAIDEQMHRTYHPVQDMPGRPLLKRMIFCSPDCSVPDVETEHEQIPLESPEAETSLSRSIVETEYEQASLES